MNRRIFLKGALATSLVATAGTSLFAYGFDTHELEIKKVPMKLGLARPLKMAVLGDIHFDPLCEEAYLDHVIRSVNNLQADLVVYTGDFISHHLGRLTHLAELLSKTESRLGSFGVLGNHEILSGAEIVAKAMESGGIRMLRNESIRLPDQDELYLTGLDSMLTGRPPYQVVFSRTSPRARHIVVIHEPDSFFGLDASQLALQVSGHTHGGQARIPLVGPVYLPMFGQHFESGLYTRNGCTLYVNRGIGTMPPHVRYNCRPELTLFELT